MTEQQPKNPLHGVTLKAIVEGLLARHGWEGLAAQVRIRCFTLDPSISSSLKFLRKTDWARQEVEALYLRDLRRIERNRKQRQAQPPADRTPQETPDEER